MAALIDASACFLSAVVNDLAACARLLGLWLSWEERDPSRFRSLVLIEFQDTVLIVVGVRAIDESKMICPSDCCPPLSLEPLEPTLAARSFITLVIEDSVGGEPVCDPDGEALADPDFVEMPFKNDATLSLLGVASLPRVGVFPSAWLLVIVGLAALANEGDRMSLGVGGSDLSATSALFIPKNSLMDVIEFLAEFDFASPLLSANTGILMILSSFDRSEGVIVPDIPASVASSGSSFGISVEAADSGSFFQIPPRYRSWLVSWKGMSSQKGKTMVSVITSRIRLSMALRMTV